MKYLVAMFFVILLPLTSTAAENKNEITMSLDDRFYVAETAKWNITVDKYLPLRFADVRVEPKSNRSFSLILYFKCDTTDLAQFDSPKKMEKSVLLSSEQYLPGTVETKITLKTLNPNGRYGFYTVLTDRNLASVKNVPTGEFKYITRGMIRVSTDSALGFSLMTNDLDSPQYRELLPHSYLS